MLSLHLILVILALCSFFVAAIAVPVPRINLLALGLFLWLLSTAMVR